jgi:ribosome maturation factor RimP
MNAMVDGRKRFRGEITGVEGEYALVRNKDKADEIFRLPIAEMLEAKLVLTDALIKKTMKREKQLEQAAAESREQV